MNTNLTTLKEQLSEEELNYILESSIKMSEGKFMDTCKNIKNEKFEYDSRNYTFKNLFKTITSKFMIDFLNIEYNNEIESIENIKSIRLRDFRSTYSEEISTRLKDQLITDEFKNILDEDNIVVISYLDKKNKLAPYMKSYLSTNIISDSISKEQIYNNQIENKLLYEYTYSLFSNENPKYNYTYIDYSNMYFDKIYYNYANNKLYNISAASIATEGLFQINIDKDITFNFGVGHTQSYNYSLQDVYKMYLHNTEKDKMIDVRDAKIYALENEITELKSQVETLKISVKSKSSKSKKISKEKESTLGLSDESIDKYIDKTMSRTSVIIQHSENTLEALEEKALCNHKLPEFLKPGDTLVTHEIDNEKKTIHHTEITNLGPVHPNNTDIVKIDKADLINNENTSTTIIKADNTTSESLDKVGKASVALKNSIFGNK